MASAQDLLRIAEAEVGNTSGKKYWDWYWQGSWEWSDGWSTPYCACFVSWCLAQAGVKCPWFPNAMAFDWSIGGCVDKYSLQPGDAVAFDWDGDLGGDHVGFVKSVHDWGIVTVEGNTNGGVVAECQRVWSVVICGLRPEYTENEEEEMTDAEMRKLAKMCAEECAGYVYSEKDKKRNLNMYNALHWGFVYIEQLAKKVDAIAKKLGI